MDDAKGAAERKAVVEYRRVDGLDSDSYFAGAMMTLLEPLVRSWATELFIYAIVSRVVHESKDDRLDALEDRDIAGANRAQVRVNGAVDLLASLHETLQKMVEAGVLEVRDRAMSLQCVYCNLGLATGVDLTVAPIIGHCEHDITTYVLCTNCLGRQPPLLDWYRRNHMSRKCCPHLNA